MSAIVTVENLSKCYLVGHQSSRERYTALRDVVGQKMRGLARKTRDLLSGKPFVQGDEIEEFWALRDVSFEIQTGEVVGIIGRNGAGKSTLLKILSRITDPSLGRVTLRGRVASLLEVGTGFHPELTGRENIFLNGAILGMGRSEIKRKFDEIVSFAEVERFLDTPVKRYSSGMYVRLAFAVAAHLDPEILVVDEVLAVGDAKFQDKCIGKMREVATGGRTVLLVSHNMASIASLCSRAILLASGGLALDSSVSAAVEQYCRSTDDLSRTQTAIKATDDRIWLQQVSVIDQNGHLKSSFPVDEAVTLRFKIVISNPVEGAELGVRVYSQRGAAVFTTSQRLSVNRTGSTEMNCQIEPSRLTPGRYSVTTGLHVPGIETIQFNEGVASFAIEETGSEMSAHTGQDYGVVFLRCNWS